MPHSISFHRALLAYILGLCFFCYAFVQRVLPSVMIDGFSTDLAAGGAALGLLSGAYFYAYACMQIPVGILVDRYGPRRLLSTAMLVCVVGSACMAVSSSLSTAALARGLIGAAVAFGFVGTLSIVGRYFPPQRFALLAGILQSAGMLGAVLGQAPLRLLVESLGWRGVLWSLAGFAAVLAMVLWAFLPKRTAAEAAANPSGAATRSGLVGVLRRRQNWFGVGLGFGLAASMLAFSGLWAVPWLEQSYALPTSEAAGLASLTFIGNAVGAPLMGWWSDRIQRRKPVLVLGAFAGFSGTAALVYGGAWSHTQLGALFFYTGLAAAAVPTAFAAVRELNHAAVSGTALGLMNMFVVGSGAVLQPLIGALLDRRQPQSVDLLSLNGQSQDFTFAFSVLIAANALGLLCGALLKESNCRNSALP